jgi:hypothetical protein
MRRRERACGSGARLSEIAEDLVRLHPLSMLQVTKE